MLRRTVQQPDAWRRGRPLIRHYCRGELFSFFFPFSFLFFLLSLFHFSFLPPLGGVASWKSCRRGSCNFSTRSCGLPTYDQMDAQNSNFAPKFSPKWRISSPKFCILFFWGTFSNKKKFSDRLKFRRRLPSPSRTSLPPYGVRWLLSAFPAQYKYKMCHCASDSSAQFQPEYVPQIIWPISCYFEANICIFTVQFGCMKWRLPFRLDETPRSKKTLILPLQQSPGITSIVCGSVGCRRDKPSAVHGASAPIASMESTPIGLCFRRRRLPREFGGA